MLPVVCNSKIVHIIISLDKFAHIQILLEEMNKWTCVSVLALQETWYDWYNSVWYIKL